jgi:hypothetical protein
MYNLQTENDKWKRELLKASIIYGDEFIDKEPPPEQPSSEGEDQENIFLQQYLDFLRYSSSTTVDQGIPDVSIQWLETNDTYTQTDLLDNEDSEVQKLIIQIRKLLSIPYSENLANRLETLFCDAKDEDVDSIGIASSSLRSFYNFLRLNTNLKRPAISLTPENNIYISWRTEQSQVFSIHFLQNDDVRFVMFKPNDSDKERKIRISGTVTTNILMDTVSHYGVSDWISDER